jgi:hypothetical protein
VLTRSCLWLRNPFYRTSQVQLDRKPTIAQCLNSVLWDKEGLAFACSSTDGHLYAHTVF